FVVSDLYNLPFKPESFDGIILGFWLSHEPRQNYDRLFDSITFPLKAKGQIWLIDNNPPAEGPRRDSVGTDQFGNNLKHRRLENGDDYVIIKNYFSREALEKIFSTRFHIVEVVHKDYYWSALLRQK
ncbi:MAG: class I SAM-dependent methyltransferase, partial [Candidatus Zixiibacteriota bacterium]